jgi:hypothetical protein
MGYFFMIINSTNVLMANILPGVLGVQIGKDDRKKMDWSVDVAPI